MSKVQVVELLNIQAPGSGHLGWPTIAKTSGGELVIVYSGGRQHHVCPFGQVHIIRSSDEGKSWSWPRTLVDGPLDDRDAGALETSRKTLIVNWFTSLAWEGLLKDQSPRWQEYPETERAEWLRRHQRLTDEVRESELGAWCIRSEDGGQSWSSKIPTQVNSPHGPCELSDGRLLYVGKKVADSTSRNLPGSTFEATVAVSQSTDDGRSWQIISEIPTMPGHEASAYHELHAVQALNGDIIAHIRNHNEKNQYEILQSESQDGGYTWTTPHPIGVWGFPPFLLCAADGRLVTTVGHRREPRGNQIAVSEDNGESWSEAMPINTDSEGDMGYPSTVELTPGRFLSLWYDSKGHNQTSLRLARWSLQ